MNNSDKSDSNRQRLRGKVMQIPTRKMHAQGWEEAAFLYVRDPNWSGTVRSSSKARDSHTEGKTAQARMRREDTQKGEHGLQQHILLSKALFWLQTAASTCTKNFSIYKFGSLIPK